MEWANLSTSGSLHVPDETIAQCQRPEASGFGTRIVGQGIVIHGATRTLLNVRSISNNLALLSSMPDRGREIWPKSVIGEMYGPPPNCRRVEVGRRNSPRKCIRPFCGESFLRALDDDPRVLVLINPSVTRDAFSPPGFPTRRWTVRSSCSLLSRPS